MSSGKFSRESQCVELVGSVHCNGCSRDMTHRIVRLADSPPSHRRMSHIAVAEKTPTQTGHSNSNSPQRLTECIKRLEKKHKNMIQCTPLTKAPLRLRTLLVLKSSFLTMVVSRSACTLSSDHSLSFYHRSSNSCTYLLAGPIQ